MSGLLGFFQPDIVHGTIQNCGANFYARVPTVYASSWVSTTGQPYGQFETTADEIIRARRVRFVLITGTNDFRRGNILDIYNGGFAKHLFLVPDPPTTVKMEATQIEGGLGFHPAFMSTTIYGPSLTKLTNAELNALATEALHYQTNPVFQAILAAIVEERKRRDDEAREKALQKPRCESGQCPNPPPPPAKSPT